MDFNHHSNEYHNPSENNPYYRPYTPPVKAPGSGFATAALALGIASILSAVLMTVYFPFILGSVAIVLAILSKGTAAKMIKQAKAGIVCAVVALVINLFLFISTFAYIIANPSLLVDTAKMYDSAVEQMYGVPSEEIFGESMEDMISDMFDSLP